MFVTLQAKPERALPVKSFLFDRHVPDTSARREIDEPVGRQSSAKRTKPRYESHAIARKRTLRGCGPQDDPRNSFGSHDAEGSRLEEIVHSVGETLLEE
jgi:hypothetical protein